MLCYIFYVFLSLFPIVPIFGVELGDQFRPSDIPAPMVMMKCIQAVEKRGLNLLNIHGIIPPGSEKNSLRTALNQSKCTGCTVMQ